MTSDDKQDFNLDWPHGHVTRDGKKAKFLYRLNTAKYTKPLVFVVQDSDGKEDIVYVDEDGTYGFSYENRPVPKDIFNAPAPKRKESFWLVIGEGLVRHGSTGAEEPHFYAYKLATTYVDAVDGSPRRPFAIVGPIEVEEGQGLEGIPVE